MTTKQICKVEDITEDNAASVYVTGGLTAFFDQVKAEVSTEVPDVTTAKGRARIDDEKAEETRQAQAREADVAHKTEVLGTAKKAILLSGVTEDQAKEIVNRIRHGLVPNVSIKF